MCAAHYDDKVVIEARRRAFTRTSHDIGGGAEWRREASEQTARTID